MNVDDYIAIAMFLFNVVDRLRGTKLNKANIERALFSNRQYLAQVLTDIVKTFSSDPAPLPAESDKPEAVEPTAGKAGAK